MRTSITGFMWSVFFLRDAFCVLADADSIQQSLEMRASEIESESFCVLVWVRFVRTEQCVCV